MSVTLAECKLGEVVFMYKERRESYKDLPRIVGHVVGFAVNSVDEILIEVKFADGRQAPIHPANLSLVGDIQ